MIGDNVEMAAGTNLTIHCEATGVPKPAITWLQNGQPIPEEMRYAVSSRGSLTISQSLVSDSGMFTCVASNIVGETKMTSMIGVRGMFQRLLCNAVRRSMYLVQIYQADLSIIKCLVDRSDPAL